MRHDRIQSPELHIEARKLGEPRAEVFLGVAESGREIPGRGCEQRAHHQVIERPGIDQHVAARVERLDEQRRRPRPARAQHQRCQSLRRAQCEMLADRTPGGMPDEMRALDPQRVHDPQQIVRHFAGIGNQRPRPGAAHTAMIVQDDAEMPRERFHLRVPESAAAAEPGDEQQRFPLPMLLDVQLRVPKGHPASGGILRDRDLCGDVLHGHNLPECPRFIQMLCNRPAMRAPYGSAPGIDCRDRPDAG